MTESDKTQREEPKFQIGKHRYSYDKFERSGAKHKHHGIWFKACPTCHPTEYALYTSKHRKDTKKRRTMMKAY